jgi:hypothetical protein
LKNVRGYPLPHLGQAPAGRSSSPSLRSGYAGHCFALTAFARLRHAKPVRAKRGGRDKDRTCDPYDVNVVLSR